MVFRSLKPLLHLEEPLWQVLVRLHKLNNAKLKAMGKKPIKMSGTISLIVRHALLRTANGVLHEYEEMDLRSVSSTLLDGYENHPVASWFPSPAESTPPSGTTPAARVTEVPDSRGAYRRPFPAFFARHS